MNSPSSRSNSWLRLLAAALLALVATAAAAQSAVRELDRIVAVVNDDVIVWSELDAEIRSIRDQLRQTGTQLPPANVLEKQVLERLIMNRIQLRLARESGIRIDDETLNRTMTRLAQQNELTLRQFRDILERDGFDFAKFREDVRDEILVAEVRKRQAESRVTVSERDVDLFLQNQEKRGGASDEFHIAQILISLPEGASADEIAQARERVLSVKSESDAGADFAQLAVTYSEGQQALEGGDLGWRKTVELPTIFTDVVPSMEPGQTSEPIRSGSGFHLVKLLGKRGDQRFVVTQTRARHILIQLDELTDDASARAKLARFRERLVNGEVFAEIARANSDDPASSVNGGEIGWISPGDVVPDFERQMDALQPGQMSEPFRTQYGWHLVEVLERREHDDTDEARRADALAQLRSRKVEEEVQTWLRQIRDEAYVEYRLEE